MPLPLSPSFSPNILTRNQNTENLLRSALDGEGVVNDGKERETEKKEIFLGVADEEGQVKNIEAYLAHQQMLEQTAIAGLSKYMRFDKYDPLPFERELVKTILYLF